MKLAKLNLPTTDSYEIDSKQFHRKQAYFSLRKSIVCYLLVSNNHITPQNCIFLVSV